jgi:hypothetical protein
MSELPDRPDLDHLRRQARELPRAASAGERHAVAKVRAVFERVTLSADQLAVARDGAGHGDYEELNLRFRPRLDPLAEAIELICTGTSEQVPVTLNVVSVHSRTGR